MKAVVLETRGGKAAVLAADGTVRVVRGKYQVGQTIEYAPAGRTSVRRWAAAAAAVFAAIGVGGGLWADNNWVAYAEVSLDAAPSIVYTVNKRDRVLGLRAVNAEAEAIVAQLEQEGVRNMPVSEAMDSTMRLLEDAGYLDAETEDYVLVNVSANDETRQDRLTKQVEAAMADTMERDPTLAYRVDRSDRATARAARDNGMSTGRYQAWQDAGEDGDRPDRAEYERMPVQALFDGFDGAPGGSKEPGGSAADEGKGNAPDRERNNEPDRERNNEPDGSAGGRGDPPGDADGGHHSPGEIPG